VIVVVYSYFDAGPSRQSRISALPRHAAFVDDDGIVVEQRKHRVDVAAGVCFEILRHDVGGGFRRGVLGHGRAKLSERALDACECGDLLEAGLTWTSNLDAGGDAGV
jgi:hypothetical protein